MRKNELELKKIQEAKPKRSVQKENVLEPMDSVVLRRQEPQQTNNVVEKQNLQDLFGPNRIQVKKKKINKDFIGTPTNFMHVAHVGFNQDKGFDTHGQSEVLQKVLQKAGILNDYV